jgi:rfaE bifunctional protein kinase chain/domain
MTPERFDALLERIASLRIGIVGDFSLDRYFDIDPTLTETSIETGLAVHHVTQVRCQPGAAGNITANLAALGATTLWPIGYCGDEGEGYELRRALKHVPGVALDHFHQTSERQTFTYSKPLLHHPGEPPEELSRLDIKNRTPTPKSIEAKIITSLQDLAPQIDALIVMDQAGVRDMGAITPAVLETVTSLKIKTPQLTIFADSRHGLASFPPFIFKMNAAEFSSLTQSTGHSLNDLLDRSARLASQNKQPLFITLAEQGMIEATPEGKSVHVPALPLRGPIDIVGAGDTVTATLSLAHAAGATSLEIMQLAQAAASLVVHQLGTTGTPDLSELRKLLSL